MKKNVFIGGVLVLIGCAGTLFYHNFREQQKATNPDPYKDGIIPTEETALKVARIILYDVFGGDIYSHEPFRAVLHDSVWVVDGVKSELLGGSPTVTMRKRDGAILNIEHL